MITRCDDWAMRLSDFISQSVSKPFIWGSHDCCLFSADCVKALTDFDPAVDVRGQYKTELGAKKIVAHYGGLEAVVTNSMGFSPHSNQFMAMRGDVVLAVINGTEFVGIIDDSGEGVLFFNHNYQLDRSDLSSIQKVWSY